MVKMPEIEIHQNEYQLKPVPSLQFDSKFVLRVADVDFSQPVRQTGIILLTGRYSSLPRQPVV